MRSSLRLVGTGRIRLGSREKAAQLVRHAITCGCLHARDEWQWNDGSDNRGSSGDIRVDGTRRLRLFQIPNCGLVGRFLLPPTEAYAACAAGCRSTSETAAAVGFARAAVEPDYITHAAFGDLFGYSGTGEQCAHRLRAVRRGAGLEPGKHLVDEIVVVVNRDAVATAF